MEIDKSAKGVFYEKIKKMDESTSHMVRISEIMQHNLYGWNDCRCNLWYTFKATAMAGEY